MIKIYSTIFLLGMLSGCSSIDSWQKQHEREYSLEGSRGTAGEASIKASMKVTPYSQPKSLAGYAK